MSKYMKRSLPFFEILAKSKPQLQKAIFQYGPSDLIIALSEIVLNTLKGVIPLSPKQKRYLARYKKQLRRLVKKSASVSSRRKFFVQKGSGIFSILLPILLPQILPDLLGTLFQS